MEQLFKLLKKCKMGRINPVWVLLYFVRIKLTLGKNILKYKGAKIRGLKHIDLDGNTLLIGIDYLGFESPYDSTILNIEGNLRIQGNVSIAKGCRIDIMKEAYCKIGEGIFINSFTKLIISRRLVIGSNCAISWQCQFLDTDFHILNYEGKMDRDISGIEICDNVWIGCNVKIYKNTFIAKGCVVAADSVVKGEFLEENCLIGWSPAKVLKRNIKWKK